MAKAKTRYICQECGHAAHKWMGQCPECGTWNALVEERLRDGEERVPPWQRRRADNGVAGGPQPLADVTAGAKARIQTGIEEFDRVLGGGITRGSVSLLAGDPGIGKSTLMTQLGAYLPERTILYVTGEESARQVKLRAERLGVASDHFLLFAETNVEEITAAVEDTAPDVLVVDSVQTLYRPDRDSAPGSVSQVRESTAALLRLTKQMEFATFVVGHVTKKGAIAGPRVLEHMVDTVLAFEGDRHHAYRILRSVKNRFGAANEIGVFEMGEKGLREVSNPSEMFLSERGYGVSGSTVVCSLEGSRPVLVEVQALVSPSSYGTPQRTATGFPMRRLQMLLAVLEKREGLQLSAQDVFINVAGGVRLEEPAVDLGVVAALASSFRDVPADTGTVLIGEVGLGGEIRTAGQLTLRLKEAMRLGFRRALVPHNNLEGDTPTVDTLDVIGAKRLSEALEIVL